MTRTLSEVRRALIVRPADTDDRGTCRMARGCELPVKWAVYSPRGASAQRRIGCDVHTRSFVIARGAPWPPPPGGWDGSDR